MVGSRMGVLDAEASGRGPASRSSRSPLLALLDRAAAPALRRGDGFASLIERARAVALPGIDLLPGLATLLDAWREEAGLSPFGVLAARWDAERFLTNLERMAAAEARDPAILAEPVTAPLVVTGLPRSGTTFLHSILARDPSSAVPRSWQTVFPYPARGAARARRDVAWQLRFFRLLAPGIGGLHMLGADAPQECTEITAHVFRSLRFDTTHRVPSYRAWLAREGHGEAYRFHRRFLQHLAHGEGGVRRWALKSPDHVFALDALRATYPDARVVFVHRDPARVLPSVARLTEVLRAPFARHVDRLEIGRQVLDDWARGAGLMVAASREGQKGAELHLSYRDVVTRPLETVTTIYRHFGMELDTLAAARMEMAVARRPDGGYGRHRYDLARYGFDIDMLSEAFRAYREHFDIKEEDGRRAAPSRAVRGWRWLGRAGT
jgi:hypothetical protein